jgi:hypothetical protein
MEMSRAELDEMLRWADELRRKLRRATRELAALGDEIFETRDQRVGCRNCAIGASRRPGKYGHLGGALATGV